MLKAVTEMFPEEDRTPVPPRPIHTDDLQLGRPIGLGVASTVYKGKWNNRDVAAKRYHSNIPSSYYLAEKKIIGQLNHPNLIKLYGYIETPASRILVLEFVEGSTLESYLETNTGNDRRPEPCLTITQQIAQGLIALHALRIIHLDMKPANILLDNNNNAKICDYSLSVQMEEGETDYLSRYERGTPHWGAPEYDSQLYSPAYDIYFLGLLMAMIENRYDTEPDLFNRPPTLPHNTPPATRALILNCLNSNPLERPTAQEFDNKLKAIRFKTGN